MDHTFLWITMESKIFVATSISDVGMLSPVFETLIQQSTMWIVKNRHQPRSNPETCLNHTSQPCRALVRPLMRRYPKNSRGPMRTPMLLNQSGICNGRPRYVCWKYPWAFGREVNILSFKPSTTLPSKTAGDFCFDDASATPPPPPPEKRSSGKIGGSRDPPKQEACTLLMVS